MSGVKKALSFGLDPAGSLIRSARGVPTNARTILDPGALVAPSTNYRGPKPPSFNGGEDRRMLMQPPAGGPPPGTTHMGSGTGGNYQLNQFRDPRRPGLYDPGQLMGDLNSLANGPPKAPMPGYTPPGKNPDQSRMLIDMIRSRGGTSF